MITIVRLTRQYEAIVTAGHYPAESIGGRYQQVWSLTQREAWLRGRAERLRILSVLTTY